MVLRFFTEIIIDSKTVENKMIALKKTLEYIEKINFSNKKYSAGPSLHTIIR